MGRIFTIGSSVHTTNEFISILTKYKINAIADVRSVPYSNHTPQYNRKPLTNVLKEKSIYYLDFSEEFGARRKESDVYTNNQIDFGKVMKLPIFITGIDRIKNGIEKGYHIALLCTEKDPLDCHRFSLVSKALNNKLSLDIDHILYDGEIVNQHNLEKKMLNEFGLDRDLFNDYEAQLEIAYEKLSKKVACQGFDESHG